MSLTANAVSRYFAANHLVARHGVMPVALIGVLHLAAFAIMLWYEASLYSMLVYLLTWGVLNFFWLLLLRRAVMAAALSLMLVVALITFSEFKFGVLWIQVSFVDLMVIETDTAKYLLQIYPWLGWAVAAGAAVLIPLLGLIWWFDPLRVRLRDALIGFTACFAGLVAVASAVELNDIEAYHGDSHVSYFARSGVKSVSELMTHGMLESDAIADGAAETGRRYGLQADVEAPAHYPGARRVELRHPLRARHQGAGQLWRAFQVLRRQGAIFPGRRRRRAELVRRIQRHDRTVGALLRAFFLFRSRHRLRSVQRGLPNVLRNCGYRTHTLFPALGAFMNSRSFQTNVGVQKFRDQADLGANELEPDKFFYDKALGMLESERGEGPSFFYIYLVANHFPWYVRWRPDLMPQWKDLNNPPLVDEYLRRQAMSETDYNEFVAALKEKFPGEPFLLVRYGDHQPDFSTRLLEPGLDRADGGAARDEVRSEILHDLLRHRCDQLQTGGYFLGCRHARRALSAAGDPRGGRLPLDPSFVEQKNILRRCKGIFYACNGGAEARRFNRLLIDAGLIKQLYGRGGDAAVYLFFAPAAPAMNFSARHGVFATASIALLHLAAAAIMVWYEVTLYSMAVFVLTWGLLNFSGLWCCAAPPSRRPCRSLLIAVLITLSELKYAALWLQLSFVDLMIIDTDTADYVLTIFPWLGWAIAAFVAVMFRC